VKLPQAVNTTCTVAQAGGELHLGRVAEKLTRVIVREANTIKKNRRETENEWGSLPQ
jgi:hypothetical protein